MPSFNSSVVYSGMMKVMRKIIAHSIVQYGVGFPVHHQCVTGI